jgi:hypothetical protein
MIGGGHSHGGGSGGDHSHGGDGSGFNPLIIIVYVIFAFALIGAVTGTGRLGQFAYAETHHGHAPRNAGSWGSLYLNIGLALIFATVALSCFVIAALRRKAGMLTIIGTILAISALIFGLVLAPHFAMKASASAERAHAEGSTNSASAAPGRPYPGATSLPPNSPARDKTLSLDDLCANLGRSQHAWLPGQISSTNLAGRSSWLAGRPTHGHVNEMARR